jgi:hypothetical protein
MFEEETTTTVQPMSNVDLISASEVPVTVATTVADITTKKGKRTNIVTLVNALTNLTDEEIEDTRPSVIRGLNTQVARITAKYHELLNGSN